MFEITFSLVCGVVLGFVWHWKLSLVALGVLPIMVLGGAINAKFQGGFSNESDMANKDADLLAGDVISNYRTVSSFAHEE